MADVHSKEIRSYDMSRIKGKHAKSEMLIRRFLFQLIFVKPACFRIACKVPVGKSLLCMGITALNLFSL